MYMYISDLPLPKCKMGLGASLWLLWIFELQWRPPELIWRPPERMSGGCEDCSEGCEKKIDSMDKDKTLPGK